MQGFKGLPLWFSVAAAMLFCGSNGAVAQDTKPDNDRFGIAIPSVEELAIPPAPEKPADPNTREAMCLMIEAAARANNLPLEFFARVIWQESRFQPDAIGPMTRRGQRAQGIRQSQRRVDVAGQALFRRRAQRQRQLWHQFAHARSVASPSSTAGDCTSSRMPGVSPAYRRLCR